MYRYLYIYIHIYISICIYNIVVLRVKPRASHVPDKHATIKLHPCPVFINENYLDILEYMITTYSCMLFFFGSFFFNLLKHS